MTGKIQLNPSSGGGSFSLQAPSSSANDRVFTLPDSADATLLTSTASLGKILQVIEKPLASAFSTTSASFVDVTGFSQAITPTAASSKIYVMLSSGINTTSAGTYNGDTFVKISRSINSGSYSDIACHGVGALHPETSTKYYKNSLNILHLDSPSYSLGNSITYKVSVKSADTAVTSVLETTFQSIAATRLLLLEVAA